MALATNTDLGTIVLSGDFYGDNAAAPSLVASGVTPGVTSNFYSQVIDTKGRTVYRAEYAQLSPADYTVIYNLLGGSSLPTATTSSFGIVQIGSGFSIDSGTLSATIATSSNTGIVQPGSGLTVSSGVIDLVTASASVLGGVKIGSGLVISSGVLSVALAPADGSAGGLIQIGSNLNVSSGVVSFPLATTSTTGAVIVGTTFSITAGTIEANIATDTVLGLVKVGSGLDSTGGVLTPVIATTSNLGVAQVGTNINVSAGVISIPTATTVTKGLFRSGTNITVSSGVLNIPNATTSSLGAVQISDGFTMTGNVLSLTLATDTIFGGIKPGAGININSGVISCGYATSSAPGTYNSLGSGFSGSPINFTGNPWGAKFLVGNDVNTYGLNTVNFTVQPNNGKTRFSNTSFTGAPQAVTTLYAAPFAAGMTTSTYYKYTVYVQPYWNGSSVQNLEVGISSGTAPGTVIKSVYRQNLGNTFSSSNGTTQREGATIALNFLFIKFNTGSSDLTYAIDLNDSGSFLGIWE